MDRSLALGYIIVKYTLTLEQPVISIAKETPKESPCTVATGDKYSLKISQENPFEQ